MSDMSILKSSASEVVETEILRKQALAQFREWIEKDPNIVKCSADDEFLLRFLRYKKFRITDAFETFVNYLSVRKTKPHLFENLNVECPTFKNILDKQIAYALPKPDKKGRLVIISDYSQYDPKTFDLIDAIRFANLNYEYLCRDKRCQLNGVVNIIDWTGVSMSLTTFLTPTTLREIHSCWHNTFPVRSKMNLFINFPPFLNALFLVFKSLLNEKMKKRFKIISSYKELEDEIEVKDLPKKFGGEISAPDMVELHKQRLVEARDEILALNNSFDIIISKNSTGFGNSNDAKLDSDIVGSFRKIEVD